MVCVRVSKVKGKLRFKRGIKCDGVVFPVVSPTRQGVSRRGKKWSRRRLRICMRIWLECLALYNRLHFDKPFHI